MKNTLTGKMLTQILSVLLCAAVLIMLGATIICPYYTISEPYHFILNPNPTPDHYTLTDTMWLNTKIITTEFENRFSNFDINDYIISMVLSFVFGLGTIVSAIFFAKDEFLKYPSMTSAIFCHITGILCGVFGILGYLNNAMLDYGVPAFMYVRTVILICFFVITALTVIRFIIWLLTTIQLAKERAARLAML